MLELPISDYIGHNEIAQFYSPSLPPPLGNPRDILTACEEDLETGIPLVLS